MGELLTREEVATVRDGRWLPVGGAVPALASTALALMDEVEAREELLETAWGIIASAPWRNASVGWKDRAAAWSEARADLTAVGDTEERNER